MDASEIKILIVDDEPDILSFLRYNLEKENYWVYSATNGNDALKMALKIQPHLVVLDVMMPGMNGIETCRAMRNLPQLRQTPIAILTALSEKESEAACMEAGANDYITKPIRPRLLLSRLQGLLKTEEPEVERTSMKVGTLEVDRERYVVICDKKKIDLPRKEFELLSLLVAKPGRVYRRDEIKALVWKNDSTSDDRTIDVHVYKLREKIGERYIKTVKGIGYKLDY
ncbi:MAG TPA: response regulator transcription factor [Chitinophagales bacterium]|nr:response regulator transcription factor [Chitinophagales bacterium]